MSGKYFINCFICQVEMFPNWDIFSGLCSKFCELKWKKASNTEWEEYYQNEKKYDQLQKEHKLRLSKQKRNQFEMFKKEEWNLVTKAKIRKLIDVEWFKPNYADRDWKLIDEIRQWLRAQPKIRKAREKKTLSIYIKTEQKQKRRFRHWYLFVAGEQKDKIFEDKGISYESAKARFFAKNKFSKRFNYKMTWEEEQKESNKYW